MGELEISPMGRLKRGVCVCVCVWRGGRTSRQLWFPIAGELWLCSGRAASGACFPFFVVIFNLHHFFPHVALFVESFSILPQPQVCSGLFWLPSALPSHLLTLFSSLMLCQVTSPPLLCPPALSFLLKLRHLKALGLYQASVLVTSSHLVSFSSIVQPTQEKGHFGSQVVFFKCC